MYLNPGWDDGYAKGYLAGQLAMRERAADGLRVAMEGWRALSASDFMQTRSQFDREVCNAHLVEATNLYAAIRALQPEEPKA